MECFFKVKLCLVKKLVQNRADLNLRDPVNKT